MCHSCFLPLRMQGLFTNSQFLKVSEAANLALVTVVGSVSSSKPAQFHLGFLDHAAFLNLFGHPERAVKNHEKIGHGIPSWNPPQRHMSLNLVWSIPKLGGPQDSPPPHALRRNWRSMSPRQAIGSPWLHVSMLLAPLPFGPAGDIEPKVRANMHAQGLALSWPWPLRSCIEPNLF